VAQECWRVLRRGGYVCVRTGTRENIVIAPLFFPAVRAMLDADLPPRHQIKSNFIASGFAPRHYEIVTEVVASGLAHLAQKSALRADPFLARLSDRSLTRECVRSVIISLISWRNEAVTGEIDWFVFTKITRR
jgi:hypothetical protein